MKFLSVLLQSVGSCRLLSRHNLDLDSTSNSASSGELYFDLESTEWSSATTNDITTDIPTTFSTVPQTSNSMTSSNTAGSTGTIDYTTLGTTLETTDYQTESTEISTQSMISSATTEDYTTTDNGTTGAV